MANTKSAKKEARKALVRREHNLARKTALKTAVKKVLLALDAQEDATKLKSLLAEAEAQCARARGKDVIHANTAARKVSRLAKRVAQAIKK